MICIRKIYFKKNKKKLKNNELFLFGMYPLYCKAFSGCFL